MLALLATCAMAQPIFEVQTVGPIPILPAVDAECVGALTSLSTNPAPVITNVANCGMPGAGGLQHVYLQAGGNTNVNPLGGPMTLATAIGDAHGIRIPIPAGATTVSFLWEFFDAEGSTSFNDAFEVSVVNAANTRIGAPLVYADVSIALANPGTCVDPITGGNEIGAPLGVTGGPQTFTGPLPVGGVYLLVLCANSSDDIAPSAATFDDVAFNAPYGCSTAAFLFDQVPGPGSLRADVSGGIPNASFLMPVRIGAPGAVPAGWCLGIDMALADLITEINFGAPFTGNLDASGNFSFVIPSGVPAGIPMQAGFATFGPGGLTFQFTPVSITTL
jgi:hypothetical protein